MFQNKAHRNIHWTERAEITGNGEISIMLSYMHSILHLSSLEFLSEATNRPMVRTCSTCGIIQKSLQNFIGKP